MPSRLELCSCSTTPTNKLWASLTWLETPKWKRWI
jgi:hypothetical protein